MRFSRIYDAKIGTIPTSVRFLRKEMKNLAVGKECLYYECEIGHSKSYNPNRDVYLIFIHKVSQCVTGILTEVRDTGKGFNGFTYFITKT